MGAGFDIKIRDLPTGYFLVQDHYAGIVGPNDPERSAKWDAACLRFIEMPVTNARGGEVFRPS